MSIGDSLILGLVILASLVSITYAFEEGMLLGIPVWIIATILTLVVAANIGADSDGR